MMSVILSIVLLIVILYALRVIVDGHWIVGPALLIGAAAGLVGVWYPSGLTRLANLVGVGRGTDLLLYILFSVGVVLALIIHGRLKSLQVMITRLARNQAIDVALRDRARED